MAHRLVRGSFEANFESTCGFVHASLPNLIRDQPTPYKALLNVAQYLDSSEPKLNPTRHLGRLKRKSASARLHGGNFCKLPECRLAPLVRESNPRQPDLWSGALPSELTELASFVKTHFRNTPGQSDLPAGAPLDNRRQVAKRETCCVAIGSRGGGVRGDGRSVQFSVFSKKRNLH